MRQFAKIAYSDVVGQVLCVSFDSEYGPTLEYSIAHNEKDIMSIHVPFANTPEGVEAQKKEFSDFNDEKANVVAAHIIRMIVDTEVKH